MTTEDPAAGAGASGDVAAGRVGPEAQVDWIVFAVIWAALVWQAGWMYWVPLEAGGIAGALGCLATCWMIHRKPEWRSSENYLIVVIVAAFAIVALSVAAFNLLRIQVLPEFLSRLSDRSNNDLRVAFGIGGALTGWFAVWVFVSLAMRREPDAVRAKCAALFSGAFVTGSLAILLFFKPRGEIPWGIAAAYLPLVSIGVMRWPVSVALSITSLALIASAGIWWGRVEDMAQVGSVALLAAAGFGLLLLRHRDLPARIIAGHLMLLAVTFFPMFPVVREALGISADHVWVAAAVLATCVLAVAWWLLRPRAIELRVLYAHAACGVVILMLTVGEGSTSFVTSDHVVIGLWGMVLVLWATAFFASSRLAWSMGQGRRRSPPLRFRAARFGRDSVWFTPLICAWLMIVIGSFLFDRPTRKDLLQGISLDAWIKDVYLWPETVRFDVRVDLVGVYRSGAETLDARIDRKRDPFSNAVKHDSHGFFFDSDEVRWNHHAAYGFSCREDHDSTSVLDVTPGSVAAQAGLRRGAMIVSVRVADSSNKPARASCVQLPPDRPIEISTTDPDKRSRTIRIDSSVPTADAARSAHPFVEPVTLDGRRVAYVKGLLWGTTPDGGYSHNALLNRAWRLEADELILDLRESRGQFITGPATDIAQYIIGEKAKDKPFLQTHYNAFYRLLDRPIVLDGKRDMELKRVIALTSPRTCGAAEALVNGLRPYLEVVTVGERTCGRPYEFERMRFGKETVYLVTQRVSNSKGEADYPEGIAPHCRIADDPAIPAGARGDPVFDEALHFIRTGRCSTAPGTRPAT